MSNSRRRGRKLARQLGGILAVIHGLPLPQLPELRRMTAASEIAELEPITAL